MANMISLWSALQQVGNSAIFIHFVYIHAQINTVGGVVCKSSSTHMCNMRPIVLTIYFTQVESEFTRAHKFNKAPGQHFLDILNVLWVTDLTNIIWVQRDSVTHSAWQLLLVVEAYNMQSLIKAGTEKLWNYAGKRKSLKHNMQRLNECMYVHCVWCQVWTLLNGAGMRIWVMCELRMLIGLSYL